ncbi:MAG: proteasome accessory factor [Frankiaceae bacterium]|nr:proteasome accessory factor [Frankiaceae bacterium]
MSTSSERLSRLLALVPYLIARPGTLVADAAAAFGVTDKQLRDDLDLLFVCGLPGYGPGDLIDVSYEGDTVTLSNAATIGRPLRLVADEALALIVALRALGDEPGTSEQDAVRRALAKLERAAGDAAAGSANVSVVFEAQAPVLTAVQDALTRGRRVHLSYYVPGRDETTERDVDPMRVLVIDQLPYLEGWCRLAEGVRMFRLDRVVDISVLDVAAELPPQAQLRDVSAGLFQPSATDEVVVLDLDPSARWVADYYPCESVTTDGDVTRATLRTADLGWVTRLILRTAGAVRVVTPASLRAAVGSEAAAALRAYATDGATA